MGVCLEPECGCFLSKGNPVLPDADREQRLTLVNNLFPTEELGGAFWEALRLFI